MAKLDHFRMIHNRHLVWLVPKLPLALILLLVADWLIGSSVIAGDKFRLINTVGVIIALQIINNLFIKVPEGLGTIWTRGLVVCPNNPLSTKKISRSSSKTSRAP